VQPTTRASFEELFRAQFATMVRLAHLLGADDPEDVAQEAFARLHPRWAGLRDRAGAGGYLRTTVVNLVRSRRQHLSMAARRAPVAATGSMPSAETAAVLRADNADLIAALGRVAPRHREALVLRFWLDLSERQIAEAMEVSAGSVKSHVSRGLSALRTELGGVPR
jgi:RNA polymerase sigma factor (sigma-70 family)